MAQLTLTALPPARIPVPPGPAHAPASTTTADDLAAANRLANVRALALTQPDVIDATRAARVPVGDALAWTFARDGSLTAFDAAGRWWDGCSVPLPAARAMLRTLDPTGRVACFLRPTQAAHLRVALDMLREDQAVVAVIPDARVAWVLLHCADFSRAIRSGRLWFATGDAWPAELSRVFTDFPGLSTPSQFIRLPPAPGDEIDRLVKAAQEVFAAKNAARAATVASSRDTWAPSLPVRRICVMAPSSFRLWDAAGSTLADAMHRDAGNAGVDAVRFDPDRPTSGSLLALASAAASCDAILTADVGRADVPLAAPAAMPWLTWVTTPRVPARHPDGPNDQLLVADEAWKPVAIGAGWPADRVRVASWPSTSIAASSAVPARGDLAIVADTSPLDPPERLAEFSSHLLLWNRLRAELEADPFRVGDGPGQFLDRAMQTLGVAAEGFDRRMFIDRLLLPAYQHGLATILLREKLPVRLHGAGWDRIDAFREHAAGPVTSSARLRRITRTAAAFVHVWPGRHAHPIDAIGRPVVRRRDPAGRSFVGDAMRALAGKVPCAASVHPPLTPSLVMRLLTDLGEP